ncbi:SbmA/BacA-like family transporter [Bosea sp. (in: a-proteobacteria)]|uniref:ABC transporter ATP-binding protein/permease n=1 Tax=Bosea sp. (in: a-proteobacteria) TaxID=1871050 RepID=UPI0025C50225|nr:SbmA/BacA-like family transporter [Bosea sp. (in: a-proteobacteria)]MBR3192061.1 ABC transporter ATP-binding protein/permease [Bosea sp. (in: a-proteobacteria)]
MLKAVDPNTVPAGPPSDWQVTKSFARLTGGFWRGGTAGRAWLWSLTLASAIILSVFANVTVNRWNGWFFDALEKRDGESALIAMAVFPVLVLIAAGLGVIILISRETFQVHWRAYVTGKLADGWIGERRFYRLGLSGYEPANPEYRIADDVRWATEPVVDFAIGLLSAVITAITFIGILWSIGGSLSVEAHGVPFEIPAYMVLAAIIYAVLVSGLITWVGRPLPRLIAARNEGEARLRFSLMRIRDHGETIALSRAETGERRAVAATYDTLVTRWLAMIRQRGRLTWITNGSGALVPVVPLLLAAPKYLSGEMSLGDVVQVAAAFVAVQNAFNWVLDNFMRIAEWLASARRVDELAVALGAIEAGAAESDIAVLASEDGGLRLDELTLTDRDGRTLLADVSTALPAGATLHVAGELGHGKAALIQAVAGLWPWGHGAVALPDGARIAVLPQHLHLSEGSLRAALDPIGGHSDDEADAVLRHYGLSGLVSQIDLARDWDKALTTGDRQRLALARAELAKPDILVLDEATSGLEIEAALELLSRLRVARPQAVMLLIGQSPGFSEAADHHLTMRRAGGVARIAASDMPRPATRVEVGG